MYAVDRAALAPFQQRMLDTWEAHMRAEFVDRRANDACDTMVAAPYVNHVPVMTGGVGRPALEAFYADRFIAGMPDDVRMTPLSRTIGHERIVDEFVFRCTHSVRMEWLLPGVPPTGLPLEFAMVVIVAFDGEAISHEHIYWDQAGVLVQLGMLDARTLPVVGVEAARKLLDMHDTARSNAR